MQNLGESVRQRLKNLSLQRKRPFDELLRYYAMERFLFRLSKSSFRSRLFLKGGLLLKIWDAENHRATMDIDFLAQVSNSQESLRKMIDQVARISSEEDAVSFNTQQLILRETQTGGNYIGTSATFFAHLFTTKIPIQVDFGFNDIIVPEPLEFKYPTFLSMAAPKIMGYTLETVIAEKLESIVKRGLVNTRMKDFYDLWTLCHRKELAIDTLKLAFERVFSNRNTPFEFPTAFTPLFYDNSSTIKRWENFQTAIRKDPIPLERVISDISKFFEYQNLWNQQ